MTFIYYTSYVPKERFTCRGLCKDWPKIPYASRVCSAQCRTCEGGINSDSRYCPCCNRPLKRRKTGKKARKIRMEIIPRID